MRTRGLAKKSLIGLAALTIGVSGYFVNEFLPLKENSDENLERIIVGVRLADGLLGVSYDTDFDGLPDYVAIYDLLGFNDSGWFFANRFPLVESYDKDGDGVADVEY